jgi:putative transposase
MENMLLKKRWGHVSSLATCSGCAGRVYSKPRLSVPSKGVTPYPYLLRVRLATAPNEVWSTGITYVSMAKAFLCLADVLYWHSRYVLSWQLSNTLDMGFFLLALADTLRVAPATRIFNSDQGRQFTSLSYE